MNTANSEGARSGGDRALVLGLGASGEAAARLLLREGRSVTVLDEAGGTNGLRARGRRLRSEGARVELEARRVPEGAYALCVVSPGVPADARLCRQVRDRRIPLLPELELGWRRNQGTVVAVTGSNGKSTLVKWLTEALAEAGRTFLPGANYGDPASALALDPRPREGLVLEVSSFQLETVRRFRPQVGILLNCFPNHLDRHGTLEAYRGAKLRLFAGQGEGDTAILPASLRPHLPERAGGPRVVTFGEEGMGADWTVREGWVHRGREAVWPVGETRFDSAWGRPAALAVSAAADALDLDPAHLLASARRFQSLPHRQQQLGEGDGVRWVDDSKATNLAAVRAALESWGPGVRLIAGGQVKEKDLDSIQDVLVRHVRAVYLMGTDEHALRDAWSPVVRCVPCGTLERAVSEASAEAGPGETILLSPGCASFDQFDGYEHRGRVFAALARQRMEE
jgi:UDP-N-acetylmuramoylalanine--D-glutamate ligase